MIPLTGDFVVVPMAPPGGLAIEVAQAIQQAVQKRSLQNMQDYEHVEVYVGQADTAGPYGYTCSAYPNKVGRRPLPCPPDQIPGALWSSGIIDLTVGQRTGIVSWCMDRQKVTYSSLEYVALTGRTLGLNTDWLRKYIGSQGHMICSQYTDAAFMDNGVHLFSDDRWPGYVMPLDLALLLEGRGAVPQGT